MRGCLFCFLWWHILLFCLFLQLCAFHDDADDGVTHKTWCLLTGD